MRIKNPVNYEFKVSKLKVMATITSDSYTLGEADGTHSDVNTRNMKHLNVESRVKERSYSTAWFRRNLLAPLTVCSSLNDVKEVGDILKLKKALKD